jgi:hypothetical protein
MKTKTYSWILLILVFASLLSACQAAPADAQAAAANPTAPAPATTAPSPIPQATLTSQPASKVAVPTIATMPTKPAPADEARNTAQSYFTAVAEGKSAEAAKLVSSFSLTAFEMTSGDAIGALETQRMDGVRWSGLKILDVQQFDAQSVLVHVNYSKTGKAAPATIATATQSAAAQTVDALWPMRLELGAWRYNWNNLIDFRSLSIEAQTAYGITLLPVRLTRFSDRIQLSILAQNRTNETVVFGLSNEILGTFYFGDKTTETEKTRWVLEPLRSTPSAILEIKGLFPDLPDRVEIRKWKNYATPPWFVFQLEEGV